MILFDWVLSQLCSVNIYIMLGRLVSLFIVGDQSCVEDVCSGSFLFVGFIDRSL